jgi:CheY-like chemotaxis protein
LRRRTVEVRALQILLVEDEESLRVTLAANLELEGHGVVEAADGRSALGLLESVQVDLVLSDVRMPGMGGVELLRRVRASHPNVPVLLMTAFTADEQLDAALLGGVFTVLKKPFDVASVVRVMTRAATRPAVLVVDEDAETATGLAETLRVAGLGAEAAFSADEALASIESGRFDVCVTDVVVRRTDALLVVRLRERWPALGVILSSANDPRELQRLGSVGVNGCLRKPIAPRDLLRSVARARGGSLAV